VDVADSLDSSSDSESVGPIGKYLKYRLDILGSYNSRKLLGFRWLYFGGVPQNSVGAGGNDD
jgi:hypothetical protein